MFRPRWTLVCCLLAAGVAAADEHMVALGDYQVQVDPSWERREPQSRILAAEFAAPAAEGDAIEGRFTVSSAGGSVEANLDRWLDQFVQRDGKPSRDSAKIEEKTIAGQKVHLLDVAGTYRDSRGPMTPVVEREGFRMLAAIVVTDEGQYFLKFYGPAKTVEKHKAAFGSMIASLKAR